MADGQADDQSAMTGYILGTEHRINFDQTQVLVREQYQASIYREIIEIHKHHDNMNRKEETVLSLAWTPVCCETNIQEQ